MKVIARFLSVVAVAASAAASQAGAGGPPQGGFLPPPPPPPGQGGPQQGPGGGGQQGGQQGGGQQGGGQQGGGQQGGGQQGGGQQNGPPSAPTARMIAMLLAMTADADKSGDVTASEWAAFIASLNPDATTGAVDLTALAPLLPPPPRNAPAGTDATTMLTRLLDKDGDGTVTVSDLNAFFAVLDADGDGAISSDEMAPPRGGPGGDQIQQGGPRGLGGAPDAHMAAMLLAKAADADQSGDVTASEWSAFLASLNADADGVVDPTALAAALPAPAHGGQPSAQQLVRLFDRDRDGHVTLTDLNAYFAVLDVNGDGALSASELAPPPACEGKDFRAALALFRAADANGDHAVTSDEWTAFLASLTVDSSGAVSLSDLASKLPAPPQGRPTDATQLDAMLVHAFDFDGDGVVTVTDLQSLFDSFDKNADGTLKRAEVKRRHKHK